MCGASKPVPAKRHKHIARGDVRASSNDSRYAGVVFTGPMTNAIAQAKAAPEYPLPYVREAAAHGISVSRYELLRFLGVLK